MDTLIIVGALIVFSGVVHYIDKRAKRRAAAERALLTRLARCTGPHPAR